MAWDQAPRGTPDKPGYYWTRVGHDGAPEIVEVFEVDGLLRVMEYGSEVSRELARFAQGHDPGDGNGPRERWWDGPLTPPEMEFT